MGFLLFLRPHKPCSLSFLCRVLQHSIIIWAALQGTWSSILMSCTTKQKLDMGLKKCVKVIFISWYAHIFLSHCAYLPEGGNNDLNIDFLLNIVLTWRNFPYFYWSVAEVSRALQNILHRVEQVVGCRNNLWMCWIWNCKNVFSLWIHGSVLIAFTNNKLWRITFFIVIS